MTRIKRNYGKGPGRYKEISKKARRVTVKCHCERSEVIPMFLCETTCEIASGLKPSQ